MAQGTTVIFEEAAKTLCDGSTHNWSSDTFKMMLITSIPSASDATPAAGDYTEVSPLTGTEYTGPVTLTNVTFTEVDGTATLNMDDINFAIDSGGPTNIKAILWYNDSATSPTDAAFAYTDVTTDGSTAVSLADGPLDFVISANGLFQVKV